MGSDEWANENKIFVIGLFRVNLNTWAMKPRIGDLAIYPSDGSSFVDTVFFADGATLGLLALSFRATLCHDPSLTLHTLVTDLTLVSFMMLFQSLKYFQFSGQTTDLYFLSVRDLMGKKGHIFDVE